MRHGWQVATPLREFTSKNGGEKTVASSSTLYSFWQWLNATWQFHSNPHLLLWERESPALGHRAGSAYPPWLLHRTWWPLAPRGDLDSTLPQYQISQNSSDYPVGVGGSCDHGIGVRRIRISNIIYSTKGRKENYWLADWLSEYTRYTWSESDKNLGGQVGSSCSEEYLQ